MWLQPSFFSVAVLQFGHRFVFAASHRRFPRSFLIVLSSSSLAAAPPRFLFPLFNDIAASLALLTCPCTALVHSAQSEHGQGAWGSDLHCQQKVWPAVQDALARSGSIVRSLQVEPLRFTTQAQSWPGQKARSSASPTNAATRICCHLSYDIAGPSSDASSNKFFGIASSTRSGHSKAAHTTCAPPPSRIWTRR